MAESEDLKICRAATPGQISLSRTTLNPLINLYVEGRLIGTHYSEADARFISHFNPAYVEKLILDRDRYREALLNAKEVIHDEFCGQKCHPFCLEAQSALKDPTT